MEARIDTHPPLDSLKAFGLGLLDDASAQALFVHLEDCPPCRRRAEEASGDDFLARLQKARAATPAPARQLPPLPGVARAAGHASTVPPDAVRSLGSSLFGPASSPDVAGPSALADLPPELAAHPQYEVIRELGRGGMGVVYLARNKQMGRLEVLKVVNRALLERPAAADRFLREIRSAAALEHKNVVRAYACLQAGKLLALVMEYVEGEDLARLVERRGPLSVASACASIVQAARGLQEAHEKGMVHRDIKPQNLLLSRKLKEVMILDFGLAKVVSEKGVEQGLTAEGKMLGTPAYVAPEQALDAASADIRADIYSLGCTLYYLLSGHAPFEAPSLFALLYAHQNADARPLIEERPDVPAGLAAVVARMMAKDPAKRYQEPADVAAALAPFVKGGKPAAPPPAAPKPSKPKATASVPPPLPAHVQVELVPAPAAERAPFDLEDLPSPAVSRRRKKGRGTLVAVALALLVPLAVGVAMAVLRIETPNGTLIVEMDGDVEAKVKGGKLILTGPDGKVRYTLSAKERNKKLDAGPYTIRVEGADGLVVYTTEFKIEKGREAKVRVTIGKRDLTASNDKTNPFIAKDMSNWEGLIKDHWSYQDGVLTGNSGLDGIKFNTFLCSKKKYKDFELTFKVRLKNGVGNSGVQIRSKIADEKLFTVAGPQCDIGTGYWGGLWGEEFGNNQMKTAPKEVEDAVKGEEFNDYYIKCVGRHLTIKLNGIISIDEDFEKMPAEGILGFQLHAGEAMEVTFKDIKFKDLSLESKAGPDLVPDRKAAEYVLSIGGVVRVNDEVVDIRAVADLPKEAFRLTHANMDRNTKVRNADLAAFNGCKHIKVLNLTFVGLTDQGLACFKDCKQLTVLALSCTGATDVGLSYFKGCKDLTNLDITCAKVSDEGLRHFGGSLKLAHLSLRETKVTDDGLAHFKDCKDLEGIDLCYTKVTDDGLRHFKECKKLQAIRLVGTVVTDKGLVNFQGCKDLVYVFLDGLPIGDESLALFRDGSSLTILQLVGTKVTDDGLKHLKNCPRLRILEIRGTKVTPAGVEELKLTVTDYGAG